MCMATRSIPIFNVQSPNVSGLFTVTTLLRIVDVNYVSDRINMADEWPMIQCVLNNQKHKLRMTEIVSINMVEGMSAAGVVV